MAALSISRKLRHRSEQLFDRRGKTRIDSYAYNTRSELTGASLGANPYTYDYDNIGNRKTAQEIAQESTYTANTLNQYSAITRNQVPFTPTFDPDGNQTLVQTSTGIWKVTYNADSRPVRFTQQGGTTTIDCGYDHMGRRYEKKITVDGIITLHQHYLYRGYLQIAALDKKRTHLPALWYTHWDPTEPTATRPLSIRKNGTWYTYGCDLTKNVQELFTNSGAIATTYDYTPFGAATRQGAFDQPFQWSSEVNDAELALTYYNYRHYNPMDGRWINRDPIAEQGGINLYAFVGNEPTVKTDFLGRNYNGAGCNGTMLPPAAYRDPYRDPNKISLTYTAFCKKDKGIAKKIVEWNYKGIRMGGVSDFDPNSQCKECECIKSLRIIMHGEAWGAENNRKVIAHWGGDELHETNKRRDISDMFKDINFCSDCTIELMACYLGESPYLKDRLKSNTGCKIVLYNGFVNALLPL